MVLRVVRRRVVSHFAFVLPALRANNMRAGKGRAREKSRCLDGKNSLNAWFQTFQNHYQYSRNLNPCQYSVFTTFGTEGGTCVVLYTLILVWTPQLRDGIGKKAEGEREKFGPAQTLVYTLRISRPPHLFCVTMQEEREKGEQTKIWRTLRFRLDTQISRRCRKYWIKQHIFVFYCKWHNIW